MKPKTDDVTIKRIEAQDERRIEHIEALLLERHLADEDRYLADYFQAEWETGTLAASEAADSAAFSGILSVSEAVTTDA